MKRSIILVGIAWCFTAVVSAQNQDTLPDPVFIQGTGSIMKLKPDESHNVITTSSNLSELDVNEAPSVISVISSKEIEDLGYPDLADLLKLFPGIQIASDVQNCNGIGIRGNWANEGKVLFMIDGIQVNDMAYGSVALGYRFPTVNISRIEFIRGSGSSIYGGLAGLGVINIVTKKGQESAGHSMVTSLGASGKSFSQARISYNYGGQIIKGVELSVTGMVNAGNLSNMHVTLPDSTPVSFKDSTLVNTVHINFQVKYRRLRFVQTYEDYNWQSTYEPITSLYRMSHSEISNQFKFRNLSVTPYLYYKWQIPWNTQYGDPSVYDRQNIIASRTSGGFTANWSYRKNFRIVGGFQYYSDFMRFYRKRMLLVNGDPDARYQGLAGFLEASYAMPFANLFAGARVDQYGRFSPVTVPRFAVTKAFKYWHYKLIYGKALKIPTLQNINLSYQGDITPETMTELQAELGVQFKNFSFSANVFDNQIRNYIFYSYDLATFTESYQNKSGLVDVAGIELTGGLRFKKIAGTMSYSYYNNRHNDLTEIMADTLDPMAGNLSFSKHKLSGYLSYKLNNKYTLSLSNIFRSQASAYVQVNTTSGEYDRVWFRPTNMLTIGILRSNLLGFLDCYLGVRNVLNTTIYKLYPYQSGYQPTVGMGRELIVTVRFRF